MCMAEAKISFRSSSFLCLVVKEKAFKKSRNICENAVVFMIRIGVRESILLGGRKNFALKITICPKIKQFALKLTF